MTARNEPVVSFATPPFTRCAWGVTRSLRPRSISVPIAIPIVSRRKRKRWLLRPRLFPLASRIRWSPKIFCSPGENLFSVEGGKNSLAISLCPSIFAARRICKNATRNLGRFRSGQTGQTVNLLAMPSKVRILPCPLPLLSRTYADHRVFVDTHQRTCMTKA